MPVGVSEYTPGQAMEYRKMRFESIRFESQRDYLNRLQVCERISSDYSFINLWAWGEVYGLEWAWQEDLVWIRQNKPTLAFWAPIGNWDSVDWSRHLFGEKLASNNFVRIPEPLAHIWSETLKAEGWGMEADRGQWDYVYSAKDLRELSGNTYHKKKNLLNQFKKKYDYQYGRFTSEDIIQARALQTQWCDWRDCQSSEILTDENQAVKRVLDAWEHLENIDGGTLRVDGQLVAFTLTEKMTADTVLIHFEKGDPEYKGVYQAINQMYIDSTTGIRFVNREQDLNDDGLRKAKLSYHPVDYLRKFTFRK